VRKARTIRAKLSAITTMICSGQIGRDRRREVFVGGAAAADLGTHLRAMLSLRDHGRPQRVDEICGCILRWPVLRDRSELGGRACPIDPHRRGRHDARRRGAVFLVELAIAATSCWPRLNENSGMMSGTRIAGAAGRPSPASGFLAILAADRAHGSCRARSSEYGGRIRSASCACRRSRAPLQQRHRRQHRDHGGAPMATPAAPSTAAMRLRKEILRVMAQHTRTPLLRNS
jgi:hypothetical protein